MAVSTIRGADLVIVSNVSLGSIPISGSAFEKVGIDVSGSIPSGYKLEAALFSNTGSYGVYCYECSRQTDTALIFRGYRMAGSASSINPKATLICRKIN